MIQFSNNFQDFKQNIKQSMFYWIFINKFSESFEIWCFMFAIFTIKFLRISQKFSEKFSTFSKSNKTIVFVPKLVQNHYIDQNLAKFFLKTPKNNQFSPKTSIFQNFRRLRRQKFGVLCPKNPEFFGVGVTPGAEFSPPKNNILIIMNLYLYTI